MAQVYEAIFEIFDGGDHVHQQSKYIIDHIDFKQHKLRWH